MMVSNSEQKHKYSGNTCSPTSPHANQHETHSIEPVNNLPHLNRNQDMGRRDRGGGPASGLLKGAGFVIGLATEVHAHHKAQKSKDTTNQQQRAGPVRIEQEGRYPETEDSPPSYDEIMTVRRSTDSASPRGDERLGYVEQPMRIQALPHPVILPQRRPNDRSRGFVRAYAPDLGRYKGIEEGTFLNFLKEFHTSSQASGWFQVINVAAMGAGFAPSAIAMAVAMSVQVATRVASEAQSRYRTNSYLDRANEELFHPRNLHCMVMTFQPEASQNAVLSFDAEGASWAADPTPLSQSRSNVGNSSGGFGIGGRKFRASDGVTDSEFAIPQAAELVYGATRSAECQVEDENGLPPREGKKESSWKRTGKALTDYHDRRAQAKFAATYGEESKLAVAGASDSSQFASRWSDPNANPFDFMSRARGHQQLGRMDVGDPRRGRERQGLVGGVKKKMQQQVLYLLIAEIPSDEEMRRMNL